MNFEKQPTIERVSKNRERLLLIEKEGKYVFHGSPDTIKVLEPRQAYNRNKENGIMEKDGEPAVFATPYADVAVFRALTDARGVRGESTSQFWMDDDGLHFSATKNILEAAKTKVGKIYILDKQMFHDFEGMQCRSSQTNVPIEVVEVTVDDLPQNIKTINK